MSFAHFNRFLSIFARVAVVPAAVVVLHENAEAECVNYPSGVFHEVCADGAYFEGGHCHPCPSGYYCYNTTGNSKSCKMSCADLAGGKYPSSFEGASAASGCFISKNCNINGTDASCVLFENGSSACFGNNLQILDEHIEYVNGELTCLGKTKSCSDFGIADPDMIGWIHEYVPSGTSFNTSEIHGTATWVKSTNSTSGYWDVGECYFQKKNVNLSWDRCPMGGFLRFATGAYWDWQTGTYDNLENHSDQTFYYCTKCTGGLSPVMINDTGTGCYYPDSEYCVEKCEYVGTYINDCTINYPLNSNQEICNSATQFYDDTGYFNLGDGTMCSVSNP